jgi:hypothetical protein
MLTLRSVLAIVGFLFILSAAFPSAPLGLAQVTTTSSQSSSTSTSAKLTLTFYSDGSIGISAAGNETSMQAPGTLPDTTLSVKVSTSGGESTIEIRGSATVPKGELNQPPFNYSNTLSASGSFQDGVYVGQINIQAVPGVNSPLSSLTLNYKGNATASQVTGSNTLAYGTYETSSGPITLDQSTIAGYIETLENEGFNATALNAEFAALPFESEVNLHVSEFSITPSYKVDSATIQENFVLTGNMTALPAAETSYFCQEEHLSSTFCSEYGNLTQSSYSTASSGSYVLAYASGLLSFNENVTGPQNFNLDKMVQMEANLGSGLTPSQKSFLNSTTYDITAFYMTISGQQAANGVYSAQFSAGGLTIHPKVSVKSNQFNESAFFQVLGSSGVGNYTIEGGSNQEGSVSFSVPHGTPTPTYAKSNSAYWSNVNGSDLAGIQFSVEAPVQTTSSSSTSSSSSTTSSSSSTIPEFPIQFLAVAVFTTLVVVLYLLVKRGHRLQ